MENNPDITNPRYNEPIFPSLRGSLIKAQFHCIAIAHRISRLLESFSYEWEVPWRYRDRAVSKHSDWLSDDFARCDRDWLNIILSFRVSYT